jgi:hypothetical protein
MTGHSTPLARTKELAARYGLTMGDLCVQHPSNDPFAVGQPAEIRMAEWFADVFQRLGSPYVHLRDLHYAILARELLRADGSVYIGTHKDWLGLGTGARKARILGLVPMSGFVDKRTQSEFEFDKARERPEWGPEVGFDVERDQWGLEPPKFWVPDWSLPEPHLAFLPEALRLQPIAVECWIEKDSGALSAEVVPAAEAYGVRVITGAGYMSYTKVDELIRRTLEDGRERVLLWLADADSDGESMAIATARVIQFACEKLHQGVPRIVVDRLALTLDQLAEIEKQIGRPVPVTPDEGREQGRVELQALAAFAPGWVADELERRLDELTDHDLDGELDDWEAAAEARIEDSWEAVVDVSAEALILLREHRDEILARPGLTLTELEVALQEIEPERQRLEQEIRDYLAAFDVDLPELPVGYVDLDEDGRDWLLDTDREFEEQLNAYRRHEPVHRRRPELEFIEPTCEGCGEPMTGRKRFCSDACRKRAQRGGGGP